MLIYVVSMCITIALVNNKLLNFVFVYILKIYMYVYVCIYCVKRREISISFSEYFQCNNRLAFSPMQKLFGMLYLFINSCLLFISNENNNNNM